MSNVGGVECGWWTKLKVREFIPAIAQLGSMCVLPMCHESCDVCDAKEKVKAETSANGVLRRRLTLFAE